MTMLISGLGTIEGLRQVDTKSVVISGTDIDLSLGNYFVKTISTNTNFSVSSVPARGKDVSFTLEVIGGSAYTITWWAGVVWEKQRPPVLSSYKDVLRFVTNDGGVTWRGYVVGNQVKSVQNSHWIATLGGPSFDYGYGIAVDSSGNVYMSGGGTGDVLIAKYNTSGTLQWQRTLGGTGNDGPYGIAVDSSGNVYITGETNSQGAGSDDVLIAKYNTSGTLQWQRTLGDTNGNYGYRVAVDSSGNVFIVGETGVEGQENFRALIAKYDSSGTIQWQRTLGGDTNDTGYGVAVDSSGNVYMSGGGSGGVLIAKYNTSGTLQWQRTLSGGGFGTDVAVDSSGNVYVTSSTSSQGAGSFDTILAKYSTSGTLQWQRILGGASIDRVYGIAVDSSGNVYITGETDSQGAGSDDVLIAKYNTSGALQWQRTLGGGGGEVGYGVAVDSSGNVYITGRTYSQGAGGEVLIAKLPGDGSGTGAYFNNTIRYTESTLTSATSTLTDAASTLTSATSTLTDQASTLISTTTVV